MIIEFSPKYTKHAIVRTQQRGIRKWVTEFILINADINKHVGKGCMSRFVSKKKLNKMLSDQVIQPKDADLVKGVVVIERDQTIQTVFHKKIRMRNR